MTRRHLQITIAAIAGGAVVLVAIAAVLLLRGDDTLADDPNGREACDQLTKAMDNENDNSTRVPALMAAAEAASKSTTPAIRDALDDLPAGFDQMPMADVDDLADACADAGIDVR